MTTTSRPAQRAPGEARRGIHPGVALAVITGAQLMVVLDATIVNLALPHIQSALNFSTTGLSWVLNAYTLTFGGLLLLGGRTGDILGRRRVFTFGILLFAFASLLGGLATSSGWLLGARALQGVGAAIASPTALALITTNFEEGPQRNRAFGVFAAVSGSGAALGLLLGGMLTEWLSWRWVLFVNVPIGAVIALLAPLYISESERHPGRFDVAGGLTSTAGMVALVYGFIRASQSGWSDMLTISSFVAAAVLLTVFLLIETRTRQPITPLHLFRNRNRAGTYVIMLCVAAALFGMFFFLTLFVQEVLGYSPLKAGLAFLPVSAVIIVAAQIVARGIPTIGPKRFMVLGSVLSVAGLGWLSRLTVSSGYTSGLLGPMLLFGFGLGFLFVPLTLTAVSHVRREESGAASSLLNAMQQVGGSLGLSILVTVFGTASRNEAVVQVRRFLATASPQVRAQFQRTGRLPGQVTSEILAHGISRAFMFAALFALIALVVSIVVIQGTPRQPVEQTEAGPAPAGVDPGGS
jgi:EmrB/QacA subfamily drug resistance transporter